MTVVEQLSTQVYRLPLPLPIADLDTVNAYAIVDDGVTLVDPGWASAETEKALTEGLREIDQSASDVQRPTSNGT